MNHKTFRDQIELYLHEELSPEQRTSFERHRHECTDCSAELEQLKRLDATVRIHRKPVEVDDRLLQEARQQLRAALRVERSRRSFSLHGFFEWVPDLNYKVLLGGATMLVGGILIGRTFLAPSAPSLSQWPK